MGLSPEIIPANIEEIIPENSEPASIAEILATQKATHIAQNNSGLIVAADTIVVFDDEILGKPANENEAFTFLRKLSANSHEVITGVCLIKKSAQSEDSVQFSVRTDVTFSELSDDEINAYIATGSPMDKAGAYGIQDDWGSVFVSRIAGCYYNVVGFPVNTFYQTLKTFAPEFVPTSISG